MTALASASRAVLAAGSRVYDDTYRSLPAGAIPTGTTRGTAVVMPGRRGAHVAARAARLFWQGKTFSAEGTELRNRLTPFGIKAIKARVYRDASWLDGNECIAIDYSKTSLVAKFIRDEIREVEPGRWLGVVFLGRKQLPLRFVLEAMPRTAA